MQIQLDMNEWLLVFFWVTQAGLKLALTTLAPLLNVSQHVNYPPDPDLISFGQEHFFPVYPLSFFSLLTMSLRGRGLVCSTSEESISLSVPRCCPVH